MSSSSVARIDHSPPSWIAFRLTCWYDSMPSPDRVTMDRLLGHLMSYLSFQVLEEFVEGMLSHWIPERHIFRFGSDELTPTLEEYGRISGLSMDGPCARVAIGQMHRQFMTMTGLRWSVVLAEVTGGHVVSMDFLVDRFSSSDGFAVYREDFSISEDRWHTTRVDALMMCVLAFLYMPIYADHMDVDGCQSSS